MDIEVLKLFVSIILITKVSWISDDGSEDTDR